MTRERVLYHRWSNVRQTRTLCGAEPDYWTDYVTVCEECEWLWRHVACTGVSVDMTAKERALVRAVLDVAIWAPHSGTESMQVPSHCRCCGRYRDPRERLSFMRDGRNHVHGCAAEKLERILQKADLV